MIELSKAPLILTPCTLLLLWTLETWLPAAAERKKGLSHAGQNLTLGLVNAGLIALFTNLLTVQVVQWSERSGFGLLHLFPLPATLSIFFALILLDAWMYLWHRANHQFHFLWRFHCVHHSDRAMDVTTAVRFHGGEILLSAILRLLFIPLLGVSLSHLLFYQVLSTPIIFFHHSNVLWSDKIDKWFRWLVVTPLLHRVHHSQVRIETDSNFATVFSFWDRLGGTFRLRQDNFPIRFGLAEFQGQSWQRLTSILAMPFQTPLAKKLTTGGKNPMNTNLQTHWDNIYTTKPIDSVSWYQQKPEKSLQIIEQFMPPTVHPTMIDVGGGASTLVDYLLADGYGSLVILDIAEPALAKAKERLGDAAQKVSWMVADITNAEMPANRYDLWHDRAVFHF